MHAWTVGMRVRQATELCVLLELCVFNNNIHIFIPDEVITSEQPTVINYGETSLKPLACRKN